MGTKLRGGEVIALSSDLGGGKTAFVRGLAQGIGSPDHVSSPTFTLSREYQGQQLRLYHFDFYRLAEPGIMRQELAEVIAEPSAVVAIEWADIIEDVLPQTAIHIEIKRSGETGREFRLQLAESQEYLLPKEAIIC